MGRLMISQKLGQKKAVGWGGPLPTAFPRFQLQHADNEIKADICNSPLHE